MVIQGQSGLTAIHTQLYWVLSGPVGGIAKQSGLTSNTIYVSTTHLSDSPHLGDLLICPQIICPKWSSINPWWKSATYPLRAWKSKWSHFRFQWSDKRRSAWHQHKWKTIYSSKTNFLPLPIWKINMEEKTSNVEDDSADHDKRISAQADVPLPKVI